mgnify:CR=1 FL=1
MWVFIYNRTAFKVPFTSSLRRLFWISESFGKYIFFSPVVHTWLQRFWKPCCCSFFFLSFFFLKDLCNICSNRAKMWDGPKEQNLSPGLNTFCGTHVQARVQRAGFCPLVGFLPKDVRVPSFHLIKAWRRLETWIPEYDTVHLWRKFEGLHIPLLTTYKLCRLTHASQQFFLITPFHFCSIFFFLCVITTRSSCSMLPMWAP